MGWARVFATIKEKLRKALKIKCKAELCRVMQLLQHLATHWLNTSFSVLVHFYCKALVLWGVLIHRAYYFGFSTYSMDKHGSPCIFLVEHNIIFNQITMFRIGKGSLARKLKIFRVKFFISGVAPLLAGLYNTVTESRRNTNISPLPMSLDSTWVDLLTSPLCAGSLSLLSPLYFLKRTVHMHLFIFGAEDGSQLIESRRGYSFREACKTSNIGLLI